MPMGKIDEKTAIELNRLSEAFLAKQKELSAIEQEMKQYVHKVMDDREMWDSLEDVAEMISYIPQNYLRFTLYERLYRLQGMVDIDSGQDAHTMKFQ